MKSPGRRSREAALLASETGQPFMLGIALATQAKIAALCGGFGHAEELAAEAERLGTPVGAATAQHARVLAAMEAAVRVTPSPSLHDGLRFARAVLAGPGEAEGLFQAALAADRTRRPFIRARTELAYGEWLRRQRRAAQARPYLRAARDTFDALGTAPWSERARHELRTAGERSGERRAVSHDILTAQELQIAQLAADGLTNREIGKRLYISHRTVGAHLAKIYAKLGATSRVQLHSALSPEPHD